MIVGLRVSSEGPGSPSDCHPLDMDKDTMNAAVPQKAWQWPLAPPTSVHRGADFGSKGNSGPVTNSMEDHHRYRNSSHDSTRASQRSPLCDAAGCTFLTLYESRSAKEKSCSRNWNWQIQNWKQLSLLIVRLRGLKGLNHLSALLALLALLTALTLGNPAARSVSLRPLPERWLP
jgi:hypothetical protein